MMMISLENDDNDDMSMSTESSSSEYNTSNDTETSSSSSSSSSSTSMSVTDHSLSPSPSLNRSPILAIDNNTILRPIMDSPICKKNPIINDDDDVNEDKLDLKQRKFRWKLKRTKSVKVWNGFTKLLSLFASDRIVHEKQMKKICHTEITELISNHILKNNKRSRHCSIIKNFEIMNEKRLCDITKNIFYGSNKSEMINDSQCFDLWNIGLIMLFMINGKKNTIKYINNFESQSDIQTFLCNFYMEKKISTNLFDLLYFFMLIFDTKENDNDDKQSRYNQIGIHLWFHK